MPIVWVYYSQYVNNIHVRLLKHACEEIVPAGLNTVLGRLSPGGIVYIPAVGYLLPTEIFVNVEVDRNKILVAEIGERTETMIKAFKATIPGCTFTVRTKFVTSSWSSDHKVPPLNDDMSMEAAIMRIVNRITTKV
jgi:hypothetical protein